MTGLRSAIFLVIAVVITLPAGVVIPLTRLLSHSLAFKTGALWARTILWLARLCCGIRWEVRGMENVPDRPVVFMAKHQSAWETLFMEASFPPQCWIIKRELLWMPFIGWGLWGVRSIAIDRSSGRSAIEQIVEQGTGLLNEGIWVSIFPEGTRIAVGKRGRYGVGGAVLATRAGVPVLPLAHNAGEFWGRYAFRKSAGTVQVVVGPPIETAGRTPAEVTAQAEEWIEARMRELNPERYAA